MIVDIDTCEWDRPGSNPSTVPIEAAIARGVPLADRAEVLRQFNERIYFDLVRIKRDSVVSERGAAAYASVVSNMGFGAGGLCLTVNRNTWKAADEQGAMVFKVNGHFYGYAAVCRNLFTLLGREQPPAASPPAAAAPPAPAVPPAAVPPVSALEFPSFFVTEILEVPAGVCFACEGGIPSVFFIPGPYFFGSAIVVPEAPPPVYASPIDEPATWFFLAVGFGALLASARRSNR